MDFSNHPLNKHNVNDNVNNKFNNNVIDNVSKSKQVDLIADKLVEKLSNPGARNLYCGFAWKLPEARIWSNLEQAQNSGRNPKALFTFLCKRDMYGS